MTSERAEFVKSLAQEIRRVDGRHDLGADALAEALTPWIESQAVAGEAAPYAWATPGGDVARSWLWCNERCVAPAKPRPLYTTPQPTPVSLNCRDWYYYPIPMRIGVVALGYADRVVYEVWDQLLTSHSEHESLYDAINEAMRLESIRNALTAQQQESKS